MRAVPSQNSIPTVELTAQQGQSSDNTTSVARPSTSSNAIPAHGRWKPLAIVISSTVLVFTACGLNFAYGIYQELYESMSHDPSSPFYRATPAMIDLIGTLSVSLMTIGAPFASAWTKAFSPRSVTLVGGLLLGLSLILSSFGTRYWHFVVTQGLLLGVGTCLSYIPAVTAAPGWYNEHRALAMGVILSGTGVGGVFWAPVLRILNTSIGFRNTLRLSGAASSFLMTVAALFLSWDPVNAQRWRVEYANVGRFKALYRIPLLNWQIARNRTFFAHALGGCIQSAAYYAPVYFFSAYGRTLGYSVAAGANFIAISNATNAIGKIIFGYLADRLGRINTLAVTTLLSSVTVLGLWLPSTLASSIDGKYDIRSKALYVAFVICYSTFASPYISLFPTSLVELFGAQNFSSVNGFFYMLRGIGTLVGTPIAGALIVRNVQSEVSTPGSYTRCTAFLGTLLAGASLCVIWARLETSGVRQWKA
ncbi:MFS general substrate transporter [Myriangium duriaei CBS 260.36]|uniref:MFS general substrate transporter n=1 Tax=Myriangium duriaei CBS 260.36 TaxID=1168546 RepID=A0A9P4MJP4_9PEZI|nr:MFS general substrate transporter [Myriangium duriaei CBS 260.36]